MSLTKTQSKVSIPAAVSGLPGSTPSTSLDVVPRHHSPGLVCAGVAELNVVPAGAESKTQRLSSAMDESTKLGVSSYVIVSPGHACAGPVLSSLRLSTEISTGKAENVDLPHGSVTSTVIAQFDALAGAV